MSRYTHGYIPPNLGKISFLDGRIKMRNAGEAISVVLVAFGLNMILGKIIAPVIAFIISALIIVLIGIPALFGVGGEPLSIFILNIINYSNSRTYVTLRPPQREVEGINTVKKRKEGRLENVINSFFIGGSPASKKKKEKKS